MRENDLPSVEEAFAASNKFERQTRVEKRTVGSRTDVPSELARRFATRYRTIDDRGSVDHVVYVEIVRREISGVRVALACVEKQAELR